MSMMFDKEIGTLPSYERYKFYEDDAAMIDCQHITEVASLFEDRKYKEPNSTIAHVFNKDPQKGETGLFDNI